MNDTDTYVVPIAGGAVAMRLRLFTLVTVLQVAVAVGVPTLFAVMIGSFTAALPIYLVMGIVLVLVLWKDPERRRRLRAVVQHPPVLTAEGLRLRAASTSGYDLRVPWAQVARLVATPRGHQLDLVVHINNAGNLAGDNDAVRGALRKMQRRPGAPHAYRIGFVDADLEELREVVDRLSGGNLAVERA